MSIVYGPVPSWRLGRSLGVDAVSTLSKTCSFDCIYCQLGRTRHPSAGGASGKPLIRKLDERTSLSLWENP